MVVFALVALVMSVIEYLHSSILNGSTKQHHTFRAECSAITR